MKKIWQKTIWEWKFTKIELQTFMNKQWKEIDWEVVKRTNNNPVVAALVENITNNTFVLVEQFRIPVWKKVIELVAWVCDKPNLTKEDIIREEIIEETWYIPKKIELIMQDIPKSPWIISELATDFYAQVKWIPWNQNLQWDEEIEVLEFDKKDLNKYLDSKRKQWILISSWIYSIIWKMISEWRNILD